jgi:hypothetical protein
MQKTKKKTSNLASGRSGGDILEAGTVEQGKVYAVGLMFPSILIAVHPCCIHDIEPCSRVTLL